MKDAVDALTVALTNAAIDVIQIILLVRSSSLQTNELSRNSASIVSARYQSCGSLSCRQSSEGVDKVDGHRR